MASDDPMTMRPFAQMTGLPLLWGQLDKSSTRSRPANPPSKILEPKAAWAYLQDRPGEAEIFGRAMMAKASVDVGAVTVAYDFTCSGRIADIGGGRGHLFRAILEAAPGAEGVLFDLPMVIDT